MNDIEQHIMKLKKVESFLIAEGLRNGDLFTDICECRKFLERIRNKSNKELTQFSPTDCF